MAGVRISQPEGMSIDEMPFTLCHERQLGELPCTSPGQSIKADLDGEGAGAGESAPRVRARELSQPFTVCNTWEGGPHT